MPRGIVALFLVKLPINVVQNKQKQVVLFNETHKFIKI